MSDITYIYKNKEYSGFPSKKILEEALREVADESPDFIYSATNYQACHYHKGCHGSSHPERGCIFGEALSKLGFSYKTLERYSKIGSIFEVVSYADGRECPSSWVAVQNIQDGGGTWGEAIKALDGNV